MLAGSGCRGAEEGKAGCGQGDDRSHSSHMLWKAATASLKVCAATKLDFHIPHKSFYTCANALSQHRRKNWLAERSVEVKI